jgi:hypothetical protein
VPENGHGIEKIMLEEQKIVIFGGPNNNSKEIALAL